MRTGVLPATCSENPPSIFQGRETFGLAIWKSVYLVSVAAGGAAITSFVPHTFYAGGHPTSILGDADHAGFEVRARVALWAPADRGAGEVTVALPGVPGSATVTVRAALIAGTTVVNVTIPANDTRGVRLWHPRGNGDQVRYNITATFLPDNGVAPSSTWRLLGFRHVALVTINDTDPEVVAAAASKNGTGQFGLRLRVNGAATYARGGNKIPMDLLNGRMSAYGHRRLVQSAREANFNMLRIWGGGIYEPRAFYDACDEFGIMVEHDMMFTWGSGLVSGASSPTVRAELVYQLERLSHHPSVVILDACNECGGGGLYESFVMPTVASVDKSRAVWPSCPSSGWLAGVDRLTSRANGQTLVTGATSDPPRPAGSPALEGHGPYIGLAAGAGHLGEGHPLAPPCSGATISAAVPKWTGPAAPSWYQSEFGCVAWSSFESISAQLPADQWSLHSNAAGYRNWPVDAVIEGFFGATQKYETGAAAFQRQLYGNYFDMILDQFSRTQQPSYRPTRPPTRCVMYPPITVPIGWLGLTLRSDSMATPRPQVPVHAGTGTVLEDGDRRVAVDQHLWLDDMDVQ